MEERQTSDDALERACIALWYADGHQAIKMAGYPTRWEEQPEIIKLGIRRKCRLVAEAINGCDARIAALESALCEIWKVWQEPTTNKEKREVIDKHWPTIEAIPARKQNGA